MKVPPERPRKTTSINLLLSAMDIPMTIPMGAITEKIPRNKIISLVEYPVLEKAPPRETAAAVL